MTQSCLVCDTQGPFGKNYINNVFDESNTFSSTKKLLDILCEIVGTELDEENVPTKILCKECHTICSNYDMYKTNLSLLKTKLSDLYYTTRAKESPTDAADSVAKPIKVEVPMKAAKGKFVVPASKLQPLPADYQLNLGKIAAMAKPKTLVPKPLLNLKMTIGNSVLTQSLTGSTVKLVKQSDLSNDKNTINIDQWNTNSLPNEIFLNSGDDNVKYDAENREMEIDEDCEESADMQNDPISIDVARVKAESGDETRYINSDNFELLLDEQDGDEQQHTIVMDGNNSILQMISGQKLVYENGQLSLVMDGTEDPDDMDEQDSNDEESQIELQVSGDEETANAIIAAAQEQGGAFIKVESGEMYRVKSVQSKPSEASLPPDTAAQLVTRDGEQYRCLVCENHHGPIKMTYTSDADSMVKHMKDQHAAKVYICSLCGVIMRNRSEYASHMGEHTKKLPQSSKTRMYSCEVCKKSYNSRTLLQEHRNLHTGARPHACPVCAKTFASKYTRQAHLKTHQVRPRPFICNTCGKSFLSQQNLIQHEKTHLGIKSFICNICNKAFGTQHSLEVHGVVHSGRRPHACPVCGKAFARRAELADHHRIHTGERPFECDVCGARFSQRSNLHSHKRATHLDDKRYACADCPKRFKRRRLLQYHVKAAHTGERPLQCTVCRATFVYPEHYKKHARIHSGARPYYCEICGKAFNSRDNRNTHRFVHSDKKPYECLACGASYMRKRMLVAHMNANGHLAESIVVNQPRVTKVNEQFEHILPDKMQETEVFEVDKNAEVSDKEEEEEDQEDGELYTLAEDGTIIANTDGMVALNSESVEPPQNMTDENGAEILRFIQVKLPDGKDGWVALND